MIYMDNAASGWPKPPAVVQAMVHFTQDIGANPGRSGHRLAIEAARTVHAARERLAGLFGVDDPLRIVFGLNATQALNQALQGTLQPGDHAITSSMEHTSVMRPLRALERQGVQVSVVHCTPQGELDPLAVEAELRPNTRLIALIQASNVVGTLLPIRDVGRMVRQHGLLFLVDAAQTAGAYAIDVEADSIDLLAFPGHKALLGPQGTGALYIGPRVALDEFPPVIRGGTGSRSECEQQPDFLPDRYESGTLNGPGLAGLAAGVEYLLAEGVARIREHGVVLTHRLLAGLRAIPGVTVYGTGDPERQVSVVSLNVAGLDPGQVALQLDERYEIMCRAGLHCAPGAHRTIGTFPRGTVRLSLSCLSTADEIDAALNAVEAIARSARAAGATVSPAAAAARPAG